LISWDIKNEESEGKQKPFSPLFFYK